MVEFCFSTLFRASVHQLFKICLYYLCSSSEIFSSHGIVSSYKMTCFLSILYKTRSGCCAVVTIGNTNLDSELAGHISLLPFFMISAIFSSKYFLNTRSMSLCLHVKHSFKSKGHVYKICLRVPFLPHVSLSFSDIFNLIKLIGVCNTSYINCNKRLSLASSHSHISFHLIFLSITLSSRLKQCP